MLLGYLCEHVATSPMQTILGQNHITKLVTLFIGLYTNHIKRYFMYFVTVLTNIQASVECRYIHVGDLIADISVECDIQ